IKQKFGDTNLLVTNMAQGNDLAASLGPNQIVLMRGHGSAVSGGSIQDAVHSAVYLKVNAMLQAEALKLGGEIQYLSEGEVAEIRKQTGHGRAWEYWSRRAGVK